MSIFKCSSLADRFNFMLICIDDFSNYMMVKLLHDKCATTICKAIIDLIREEGSLPTIIYCDQGSEFKNKLFNNPKSNKQQSDEVSNNSICFDHLPTSKLR